jgi:hypothetical protein
VFDGEIIQAAVFVLLASSKPSVSHLQAKAPLPELLIATTEKWGPCCGLALVSFSLIFFF